MGVPQPEKDSQLRVPCARLVLQDNGAIHVNYYRSTATQAIRKYLRCPSCSSIDVGRIRRPFWARILPGSHRYRCCDCHTKFLSLGSWQPHQCQESPEVSDVSTKKERVRTPVGQSKQVDLADGLVGLYAEHLPSGPSPDEAAKEENEKTASMRILEFFRFSEQPFSITPDPKFLYMTDAHRGTFAKLLFAVENRKGFMVLAGEVGTGKSTICRALLQKLHSRAKTALVIHPGMPFSEMLQHIVEDLGIEVEEGSRGNVQNLFRLLNDLLYDQISKGKTTVLIIDEAQNLSPESIEQIRLLSNFETDKEKLLQIILVGQPELLDLLQSPELEQLRQRVALRCDLSQLEIRETEAYIEHRIDLVSLDEEPLARFEPRAMREVFLASKGIPRVINAVCDRALLLAFLNESTTILPVHVRNAAKAAL